MTEMEKPIEPQEVEIQRIRRKHHVPCWLWQTHFGLTFWTITGAISIIVKFDLPVKTNTTVTLTEDTFIKGASVSLATSGLSIISAPTDITLPAGAVLPIALNISIPVNATVLVDIPLNQTELREPFNGLQNVLQPPNPPCCKAFLIHGKMSCASKIRKVIVNNLEQPNA
jgi:hypothetical protein